MLYYHILNRIRKQWLLQDLVEMLLHRQIMCYSELNPAVDPFKLPVQEQQKSK